MTADDILRNLAVQKYRRSCCCPRYTPKHWFECDLYEVTPAGFGVEYEVKLSLSDFAADAGKRWGSKWTPDGWVEAELTKHQLLERRDIRGPSRFWFVVPEELSERLPLPDWAGLIRATECPSHKPPWNVRCSVVKSAPQLHKNPVEEKIKNHMKSVFYYRFHGLYTSIGHSAELIQPTLEIED